MPKILEVVFCFHVGRMVTADNLDPARVSACRLSRDNQNITGASPLSHTPRGASGLTARARLYPKKKRERSPGRSWGVLNRRASRRDLIRQEAMLIVSGVPSR